MSTMFVIREREIFCAANTWFTISAAVRFLTSPLSPVLQNPQPDAQPTWVETQSVSLPGPGMSTPSIVFPSSSR